MAKALDEKDFARVGAGNVSYRAEDVAASAEFRADYVKRPNVITSEQMPFEQSADGYIKHLIHHKMNTPEMCIEAYMQFIKPGEKSGKHRHMWEEVIFVAEGSGYDLHWDFKFDCIEEFEWQWEDTPKKFEWKRGDFIYVPPFVTHQHFAESEARLIVISNRIFKEIGFDWFDQLEDAPKPGT
jgi:quercetin dioxygenase-like cupin family protein